MMHQEAFNDSDFLPLENLPATCAQGERQQSYWFQVWQNLKAKPAAVLSLAVLVLLLLFCGLGPLIWTLDPASQDLSQISQGPSLSRQALVVPREDDKWKLAISGQDGTQAVQSNNKINLDIHGLPHTMSIKMSWTSLMQAASYRLYRHEYIPSGVFDLGLPLVELDADKALLFEDSLGLESRDYYYSVLALDENGQALVYETIKTTPALAIPVEQAHKQVEQGHWHWVEEQQGHAYRSVRLSIHPMGTDYLGRDMMARLMLGGQTSLFIALFASLFFVALGSLYGAVSAYSGGHIDNAMMRFADFVIALPFLLFMILLKVMFSVGPGESGIKVMIFSLIILSWPSSARLVRGQVLMLREQNFVLAARINGASASYIIFRHFFPNVLSLILVSLSFAIPSVILTEAFLSFIGLGVVPPTPSWGSMCQEGIKTFLFHPHELIFPSACIAMTVLAFNILGDSLRDAMDVNLS